MMDQLFIIRRLFYKTWKFNKGLHALFFSDFIESYVNIHKENMYTKLKQRVSFLTAIYQFNETEFLKKYALSQN